jgi:hypothetical protein
MGMQSTGTASGRLARGAAWYWYKTRPESDNLAVTKKTVGDEEKLSTYLNSALKVLLGTDIFPRVPKMLNLVD